MSDESRIVPPEQLPSDGLHPLPMPVINLGHLIDIEPAVRARVVGDIAKACYDLGYFQVINHGISQSVMDGAVEAASDFFKLPSEIKEEFASDDIRQPVRYDTSSKDGISLSRALLKLYARPLSDWVQYWSEKPPIYRLGLGKDYQQVKFEDEFQLLSVNRYPKESEGDSTIGLAAHSDYGFLTILLASSQGLDVVDRNSDSWIVGKWFRNSHMHCMSTQETSWKF
ncbi:hypothetical protein ZWY2020_012123 [Hordeum vulgare]|nr:hypothetical protein ZWY2020_012123 [Hordeum vulgare]